MSTTRIQFIAHGRRATLFRAPDLMSADHPWAGFSFEEANAPSEPMPSHSWSKTTLLYVTGGQGSLRWKHRGVWSVDPLQSGTVSITRRDVEIQSVLPSGSFRMMVLQLDGARFQELAPAQIVAIEKSLSSVQVTRDVRLAALLSAMSAEVKDGCASGRLYGESISIAFLAYLAGRYATPPLLADCEKSLSPAEMRTLVGFIRENLANNISVTELAGLVQMRPSHFARIFKASFGITPYQFVMRERVASAKELFVSANLSASQVASEIGFSSQSHFVKVFRQFTGVTPKQYQAGL
ncbi:transcriptional regulator, AraC family [Methylocella silvestris BL2]|uniref:Transcriptional regulator, AraC family n=1 Tax=Methylocella silvestris (strain DSM 15510 / CIP 108128 / LMG 27833 / NCIMB 13906 / BL2) TaxID=395965 RepID=B8EM17_METSB|nr:AraC family transcriptional regulator [Methylocella silvestris]ACK50798.1 transcriptional regulator, AraC family [Methylocella silvestris BL2]